MMKKAGYALIAVVIMLFAGCYEITEDIVISDKGAGTYVTKMDMSGLLQMMHSMGSDEELSKNGLDRAIDTTIYLKSILDTTKQATEEQKRLFKDGTIKLQMNVQNNLLKTDVYFPFKSFSDLQGLMSGASTTGLADVFKKVFSSSDSSQAIAPQQDQGFDQINTIFDVAVNKSMISKKLNRVRYDSLMMRPEMAQLKQMGGNNFEIAYTTVIHLPRPVKKADGSYITLSGDKKTVTLKYDMMKMLESPEKFSYTITY